MTQPVLRRTAAAALIVSAMFVVPATAGASRRPTGEGKERAAAVRSGAMRHWLVEQTFSWMEKMGVRIDPDGVRIQWENGDTNRNGVRIDPDGHR